MSVGTLTVGAGGTQSVLAADTPTALETIIVTAQRRAENQRDVPISISTIDGRDLFDRSIRTLEDLNGYTPGLLATNTVSYSAAPLSIRGIGGANGGGNFFNDEPVAVYVDGVYVTRLSTSTADLLDIESIQVLRGPQGTLYGRNSTAGAILITTNAPSSEGSAELRASVARFGEYRTQGFITGAFAENVSARAAVGYSSRDGYGTNSVTGENVGGGEDFTARLFIRFQPSNRISLDLIGEYQDRSASPALIAITNVGDTGAASPYVRRPDLQTILDSRTFTLNDVNDTQSATWSLTTRANIDLGFAALNVITGYRDWSLTGEQDSDSTARQLFTNNGAISSRQFSHEMRLTSENNGPLLWLAGGYYLNDDSDVEFSIQNFQGLFGLGTNAAFDAKQSTSAFALFADLTYDLTDRFSITAGARYSHERKEFENDLVVSILNGGTTPPTFMGGVTLPPGALFSDPPEFIDDASFSDFSPRAVFDFKPNDSLLLFASYSQGFKSGGFNSFGLSPAFNAENIHAYEVGVKTEWAQGRVRLNASGFIYDYSDLQIRLPVPTGGVDIQNVAAANIKGFEAEGTALLMDGFTVTANIAVLDTEINEGLIPAIPSATPPFPIGAPLPLALEDVSGNQLTRAPAFQSFVSATYQKRLGPLSGALSASYRFQDQVFFLETNQDTDTFRNDAWGELNLRASVSDPDEHWGVTVFLKNVTNNRHVTAVTALGGFPNAALNEPRQWGIDLSVRF